MNRSAFLLLIILAVNGLAADQPAYTTPSAGSPLRKQLLDVIRVPAEDRFGQTIVFKVSTLRATDTWAFFVGTAIQPNGNPVDFRKSKEFKKDPKGTQDAFDAGALYGSVDALLKKDGPNWKIVVITYEAGDVHWLDYDKRYGAPKRMISDPLE